jgi:hypothetical protein
MDGSRFDTLIRVASQSRRSVLGALIVALAGPSGLMESLAKGKGKGKKGKGHGNKHKGKKQPPPNPPQTPPSPPLTRVECPLPDGKPCPGCCDKIDPKTCVPEPNHENCGKPGTVCVACNDDVKCHRDVGACICDRDSCFGCCTTQGDKPFCNKHPDKTSCGINGQICKPCPANQDCDLTTGDCKPTACIVRREGVGIESVGVPVPCGDTCCPAGTSCTDEQSGDCCPLGGLVCEFGGECCVYPNCCFINPCELGPINVCLSPGDGLGGSCGPNGPVGITYNAAVHGENCRCGRGVWEECPG